MADITISNLYICKINFSPDGKLKNSNSIIKKAIA